MDSLSFNKTQNIKQTSGKVSFTGQKSVVNAQGVEKFKFYTPPFDKSSYNIALEVVALGYEKDSNGRNTGAIKTVGEPRLLVDTIRPLTVDSVVEVNADDPSLPLSDMVGYRFVLIDKADLKRTGGDVEKSRRSYILDSGAVAKGKNNDDSFTYFSRKQGFVNKSGPMYHIFPDAYNVKKGDIQDRDDFVRNAFNKAGGTIQGMIEKIKEPNSELEPYEMIISTPLFGGDDISSHGYWTANPYQIASVKGTFEDFKELQTAMFDAGKSYVADGAFTSQSFEGPQFQHVLKWGKDSPFYNWFKLDKSNSAPNSDIRLGILPDSIITKPGEENSEHNKKAQMLKENIAFKIVNPDIKAKGYTYDPTKPTYIQFYDKRFAGKQGDDIENLIVSYDKHTLDNHYEVVEHQDSVQPFYFEVDPSDKRFKTKGASLAQLEDEEYMAKLGLDAGYDSFFQFGNYTVTTKAQSGGATTWDGNVDLVKMNISSPTDDKKDVIGNKQVKNNFYNIATFWTKATDGAILEHLARRFATDMEGTLDSFEGKFGFEPYEAEDLKDEVLETGNETFRNMLQETKTSQRHPEVKTPYDRIKLAVVNFPFESVEFAPDLTAVLSTDYITPRLKDPSLNEKWDKIEFLEDMSPAIQSLYNDKMYDYLNSVLHAMDDTGAMGDRALFDQHSELTDYGKIILDLAATDIMRFGTVKGLFPDEVSFDETTGAPVYSKDLKSRGVISLGINATSPENEAMAVASKLGKGFKELAENPDEEFVKYLVNRFKDIDIKDYEVARAFMDKTGAGLNWRFDAAKDVADLDSRRAQNPLVTFEDCWDEVIDFWGGFIEKIREQNKAAYTVAEVTNLWEFSMFQGSNKNALAEEKIAKFNSKSMSKADKKYEVFKFYKDYFERIESYKDKDKKQKEISRMTIEAIDRIDEEDVRLNPDGCISDAVFEELKNYFLYRDPKSGSPENLKRALFLDDFGKYVDPNIAERMLYDKTGATTGSNYSTFFGLYPELFGQNYEHGTTNLGRLYNMKAFEESLSGFFSSASPQFVNSSHIFVNNHDKPRPLHTTALDAELFLSDLQTDDAKQRARAVIGNEDLDGVSSRGVAVGEAYDKSFAEAFDALKLDVSSPEFATVKQAIADLTQGKFLNFTEPDMQRSMAFGYSPFDITIKDVILQARYLSETKGMPWSLSGGKPSSDKTLTDAELKLYNKAFECTTAPALEKIASMWEMMCCAVGVPTLFAGDELAHSGYETPTKNVELAIRNLIHHEWLTDPDKAFVQKFNDKMMAASKLHKDPQFSALADGSPIVLPQKNKDYTALYKYNDRGSGVIAVYSTAEMPPDEEYENLRKELKNVEKEIRDKEGNNAFKDQVNALRKQKDNIEKELKSYAKRSLNMSGKESKYASIDLSYLINPSRGDKSGKASIVDDKAEFLCYKYDKKTGKYETDGKRYAVKQNREGANVIDVNLDSTVSLFVRVDE